MILIPDMHEILTNCRGNLMKKRWSCWAEVLYFCTCMLMSSEWHSRQDSMLVFSSLLFSPFLIYSLMINSFFQLNVERTERDTLHYSREGKPYPVSVSLAWFNAVQKLVSAFRLPHKQSPAQITRTSDGSYIHEAVIR